MSDSIDMFTELLLSSGAKLTFSKNCHCGVSPEHQCGCWRCRKLRGEEVTEATEKQAEADSKRAQEAMRKRVVYQEMERWRQRALAAGNRVRELEEELEELRKRFAESIEARTQ